MTNKLVLASTLHDPDSKLIHEIPAAASNLLKIYKKWIVITTETTNKDITDILTDAGALVYNSKSKIKISENPIENDHLNAIYFGLKNHISDESGLQYTDGDRIILAASKYHNNLANFIDKNDIELKGSLFYLNIRRDAAAFLAHHKPLITTEFEFNRAYSMAFKMQLDIGSTGHIVSFDIAEKIIEKSPQMEALAYPHPKWLIIAKLCGANIDSTEAKQILTFETPLQFQKEVQSEMNKNNASIIYGTSDSMNDYHLLQKAYSSTLGISGPMGAESTTEWKRRISLAKSYLLYLNKYLENCVPDINLVKLMHQEINSSINQINALDKKIHEDRSFEPNRLSS